MSYVYLIRPTPPLTKAAALIQKSDRLLIMGSPGTGKTTFSNELIQLVKLPYFSLDDLYWGRDWTRASPALFHKRLQQVLKSDHGLIDGNYHDRFLLERLRWADTIIYLDFPTSIALLGLVKRSIRRYWLGKSAQLPAGVVTSAYKRRWELTYPFVKKVLHFRRVIRPQLICHFDRFQDEKNIVMVGSRKIAKELLQVMKTQKG